MVMRLNVCVSIVIGAALLMLAACDEAAPPMSTAAPAEDPRRLVTPLTDEHRVKTDGPQVRSGLAPASAESTPFTITWEVRGTLEADTIHVYPVTVNRAGTLTARTTGSSGADTYGYLKDSGGTTLAEADDGGGGTNFRVSSQVTAGGYAIWVTGASRGVTGRYVLRVDFTVGGDGGGGDECDDHCDTRSEATSVAPGSSTAGVLTAGDVDYFRVTLSRAGTLTVSTEGSPDTHGTLEDASGDTLAIDDDDGVGSNFLLSREAGAGTYYVKVRGYSGSTTGNYRLHVAFTPGAGPPGDGDDHGDTRSEATGVAAGSSTRGVLTAGDVDYFRVTLSQAGTLTASTVGGTDTYGQLEDAGGTILDGDDDGGSGSNFRVSAPVGAGTYYIVVKGYDSRTTGSYTVTAIAAPRPNEAPQVVQISDATLMVDGTLSVTLSDYYADPDGDPLTYTAASSDEPVATVAGPDANATITVTAQAAGITNITVTATDDKSAPVATTFTVTVLEPPQPPNDPSRG